MEVRYEEGIETGEMLNIIRLVKKKLLKSKSIAQIADEVEESTETVEDIVRCIEATDTDDPEAFFYKSNSFKTIPYSISDVT